MSQIECLDAVFREPDQWGLRGDPLLWRELRERFSDSGIPKTAAQFTDELVRAFEELTGGQLFSDESVFVCTLGEK